MARRSHKHWMSIGLLATGVIFLGHYLLPEQRVVLHPAGDVIYNIYGAVDAETGRSAQWLNEEDNSWTCHYKPHHSYGCGWNFLWDTAFVKGRDLSRFEALEIDLDYEGSASRVRVYMRAFNPDYATPDNIASTKFLATSVPVDEVQEPVRVEIAEFSVASWWLREQNVRRQSSQPEFDNIVQFGVDIIEVGQHKVRVNRVVLVGHWVRTETLLLLVLGVWMALFFVEGLVRFYQLYRKSQQERQMIQSLEERQNNLEREKKSLKTLADIDALTGIFNRTGLESYIVNNFGARGADADLGILLIDIDHFKQLNDTYGHNLGDKVLKAFAAAMSANLRESDAFARWGGEEFVIVCQNQNIAALQHFANKLRVIASQYTFGGEREIRTTISIGVALSPLEDAFDEALKRADRALYRAKHGGRNRVEVDL